MKEKYGEVKEIIMDTMARSKRVNYEGVSHLF